VAVAERDGELIGIGVREIRRVRLSSVRGSRS
jgi:hypothetical protein